MTKRFLIQLISLALFCCVLVGCETSGNPAPDANPSVVVSEAEFEKLYPSEAALRQIMSGATSNSWSPQHGTQIEYTAANGRSFLWYPGNQVILPAEWKVEADSGTFPVNVKTENGVEERQADRLKLCYRYGRNTYNHATRKRGGNWQCQSVVASQIFTVGTRKGDVFGLSKRATPPFVLKREKTTIDQLLAQCRDC